MNEQTKDNVEIIILLNKHRIFKIRVMYVPETSIDEI